MEKVDKYDYNVKSDEIKKLYNHKDFADAAAIADEIDWYKVKDKAMLSRVADIYENTKQYEKAKEILLIAYERSPLGRQLAYKLTILSLRTQSFDDADEFYQDFVEMSPTDDLQYLLKYRIARAKGQDKSVLIEILETYLKDEKDERWQYELAKLYHADGQDEKCIEMCNEIEVWFGEGKYVTKARKLRSLITGVMEEYNQRYIPENFNKVVVEKSSQTEPAQITESAEQNTESAAKGIDIEEFFPTEEKVDDSDEDVLEDEDVYAEESGESEEEDTSDDESESNSEESQESQLDEIETLAESIVEEQEAEETMENASEAEEKLSDNVASIPDYNIKDIKVDVKKDPERTFGDLKDKYKSSAEIKARWSNFTRKIETEDLERAQKVLDAAMQAAIDAQKSADIAKAFAYEVKVRVDYLRGITPDVRAKNEIDELKEKLEEQDNKLVNKEHEKIDGLNEEKVAEIFENKDAIAENPEAEENNEEKTVSDNEAVSEEKSENEENFENEVNPDEIKVPIVEDSDDPSKTANIQEALRRSMEKLRNDAKSEKSKKVKDGTVDLFAEEEPVKDADEESTEENKEAEQDIETAPTKRIDSEEVNRLLEEAKEEKYHTVPLSPLLDQETDGQISMLEPEKEETQADGQMSINEVIDILNNGGFEEEQPEEPEKEVEEIADVEEVTPAEEVTETEEVTPVEEVTETEEVTPVEEVTETEEVTPVEEITPIEEITSSEDTKNEAAAIINGIADMTEMTEEKADNEKEPEENLLSTTADLAESVQAVMNQVEEDAEVSEESEEEDAEDIESEVPAEDEAEESDSKEQENTEEQQEEVTDEVMTEDTDKKENTEESGKKHVPEEYAEIFKDFASFSAMEDIISDTLSNLVNNFVKDGTSSTNNVIVTGSAKTGKTTLGLSLIRAANRGRGEERRGRKVAKIKATAINKRGMAAIMTNVIGADMIIEQAGNLMPNSIIDLMTILKNYTEEMIVVLEDDKAAIDRMLISHPDLKKFFTNRIDIVEMEIEDMVRIAKQYAMDNFYEIDAMGELSLYAKLDDISGKNPDMTVEDIEEVIDDAIENAKRFSIGKIFGRRKKGKGEYMTLTEQDFL